MNHNPYAEALGENDVRAVLARTPERLAEIVGELTAEQVEAAPAPGKWSVREVLAHLVDCDTAFGFRMRQVYGGEPNLQPFDQTAWGRAYGTYTAAQALETFRVLRAWNVAFVDGLTEADKELVALHPEFGEMRLWTIAETMAGHDLHHLRLLEK